MTKLIAETAWHHEGDFPFMKDLVRNICESSLADVVKLHITLDLDEYMSKDHEAYEVLRPWMFTAEQWAELIQIVQDSNKELMLLLNDTTAVEFASKYNPSLIELHSVCLNVPRLQNKILEKFDKKTKIVIGIGGCTLQEVDAAIHTFCAYETILMFGFQNYPTKYEDVNLSKIRKIQSLYGDKSFGYADHTGWDEKNNEFITLMVAANGMDYIEKHVTTEFGNKRCDYSAAVSFEMLNSLGKKMKILDEVYGDGSLSLNLAEKSYSNYGPMKMAAITKSDLKKGEFLLESNIHFCRTRHSTDMSQIDTLDYIGKAVNSDISAGQVLSKKYF